MIFQTPRIKPELASGWDFSESRISNPDPGDSGSGFFILGQIEKSGFFLVLRFLSPGFFLISGFLSPGFSQNPRDLRFFRNFLPSGYPGNFYPRDRIFFRGMVYPDKKPPLNKTIHK